MDDAESLIGEAAQKLKRTIHEGRIFQAAQVKIVGLDDIRRAAGDHWPTIKHRVRSSSMTFLQGALGADDLVIPCGDGFLVIYADQTGRDFDRETEALQDALNAFYIGEEALENLRAKVRPHTLSAREMVGLISKGSDSCSEAPTDIRLLPTCNIRQAAITCYRATPARADGGAWQFGYNPDYRLSGRHVRADFLTFDLQLLDRALSEAKRICDGPERSLIGYNVHVSTIKNRVSRERVLERLAQTPANVRRLLVGRLAEVELGTPLSNLAEWVGLLRRFTPRVSLELHATERAFDGLGTIQAFAAGFSLPPPPPNAVEARARLNHLIARWRQGLDRQRLDFFLDHVEDPHMLTAAYNAGVDLISSARLWPSLAQAAGVRSVSRLHELGQLARTA